MANKMFLTLAGWLLDLADFFKTEIPKTSIAGIDTDDGDGGDWWANAISDSAPVPSFPIQSVQYNSRGSTALN